MNSSVTIGLDLGRRTGHQATVHDPSRPGRPPYPQVETSAGSLDKLVEAGEGPDVTVVLEPTGLAWLPVAC